MFAFVPLYRADGHLPCAQALTSIRDFIVRPHACNTCARRDAWNALDGLFLLNNLYGIFNATVFTKGKW